MKIDLIPEPCTFYYEDDEGKNVPFDFIDFNRPNKWRAQHSKFAIVQHSTNFAGRRDEAWPIKVLKWLLEKCPDGWKRTGSINSNCTIAWGFPVIKYLVENRKFKFNDACVIYSDLCSRCSNIVEDEVNGVVGVNYTERTHCSYCKVIDPGYAMKYKIWRCYRAFKYKKEFGTTVREVYEDIAKDELL